MLEGTCILVTGGMGRLGEAIWQAVEREGGAAIVASRDQEKVDAFNRRAERQGLQSRGIVLNFSSEEKFRSSISDVIDKYPRVTGLVNNAFAALRFASIDSVSWKAWEESSRISLAAPNTLSSALVGQGHLCSIVNISSVYGVIAPYFDMYGENSNPSPVYYGSTKAGLIGLTRYMAARWADKEVRANAVSPAGIFDNQEQEFLRRYSKTVPMGRMVTRDEVANVVCFLLSDKSSGITGQNIVVDAGKSVW